jgi:hypothetical protein
MRLGSTKMQRQEIHMKKSTAGALVAGALVAGLVLGSLGIAYAAEGRAATTSPVRSAVTAPGTVRSLDATTDPSDPGTGTIDPNPGTSDPGTGTIDPNPGPSDPGTGSVEPSRTPCPVVPMPHRGQHHNGHGTPRAGMGQGTHHATMPHGTPGMGSGHHGMTPPSHSGDPATPHQGSMGGNSGSMGGGM